MKDKISKIRKYILDEISEDVVFLEPEYDSCIIDIDVDGCHVIYDWNKMVEKRMELYGEDEEDAVQFLDYNYVGCGTRIYDENNYPIIIGDNIFLKDYIGEENNDMENIEVKIYNKETGVEVELNKEELRDLRYYLEYFADTDLSLLDNKTIESLRTIIKLLKCDESLLRSVQSYLD